MAEETEIAPGVFVAEWGWVFEVSGPNGKRLHSAVFEEEAIEQAEKLYAEMWRLGVEFKPPIRRRKRATRLWLGDWEEVPYDG